MRHLLGGGFRGQVVQQLPGDNPTTTTTTTNVFSALLTNSTPDLLLFLGQWHVTISFAHLQCSLAYPLACFLCICSQEYIASKKEELAAKDAGFRAAEEAKAAVEVAKERVRRGKDLDLIQGASGSASVMPPHTCLCGCGEKGGKK